MRDCLATPTRKWGGEGKGGEGRVIQGSLDERSIHDHAVFDIQDYPPKFVSKIDCQLIVSVALKYYLVIRVIFGS